MHFPDDNETFPPESVLWHFPYSKPKCVENPYLEDHSADVTKYSFFDGYYRMMHVTVLFMDIL